MSIFRNRWFSIFQLMSFGRIVPVLILLCLAPLAAWGQTVTVSGDSVVDQCQDDVNDAGLPTYTITLENTSGETVSNIRITTHLVDLVPGFTFVTGTADISATGNPSFCSADPTVSGTDLIWDVDTDCGGTIILADAENLTITFSLETGCEADSGSLDITAVYDLPGVPDASIAVAESIQVNSGAVTITKVPATIPAYLGEEVTWTLTVENTGAGVVENVEVTDELEAGLVFVSATQSGSNAGQITTWTSAEYAALASMGPGDTRTMEITATVIASDNVGNKADVRFGCNPRPANTCFDTDGDGGTATASAQASLACTGEAFVVQDASAQLVEVDQTVSPFVLNSIGGPAGFAINALGFRRT
ncbi:MAG: DUF11 domain-containing protein, partial [Gammaproteobacteria bacterium]|nr:DUF11 domain-containing protein [Gammaproteobacteria bacterium]